MNERIKELRLMLGMTQREFAAELGMKQNTIATWEMGRGNPSSRAVREICRIHRINEEWLRGGDGPMYLPSTNCEEIAVFVSRAMEEGGYPRRLLLRLARLTPGEWAALEKLFILESWERSPDTN